MLYEKLLTAVEETSTFGLEWGGSGTSGVFLADDVTFPVHHHLILVSHVFIFENRTNKKKKSRLTKAVHEELPPSKI